MALQLLDCGRAQPAPDELVDGGQQELPIAGEVLRRIAASARVDDRRDVVGAEVALDELARRFLDERSAKRADVEVVEHDHVNPSIECAAIRARVGVTGD